MTAEEFIVGYLKENLDVHVSGDVPSPRLQRFVTVEQTGSKTENQIYHPTIALQSWAESRAAASELNEKAKTAMAAIIFRPEVSSCRLDTDYNFPDLETKQARYQAMFEITYLE